MFQNLNSDFTDSALGSTDKSALPFGDFRMRESTMQSILNNPKYGPRSELGMYGLIIAYTVCFHNAFSTS